jgi:hypothetical protein
VITAKSESEELQFDIHPQMIWSVLQDQAGSLMKAIQEGVQNSVDSGSTYCNVTLAKGKVVIEDDGRGFQTREEIVRNFKTFGTPHEKGDAVYGRWRMGRGQLFSYGYNLWLSGPWVMAVDIKPQQGKERIGFSLSQVDKLRKGCRIEIELYDKLKPSEMDTTERELKRFLKYAQIPVTLNGHVINVLPKDKKWDLVTDDAYFDLRDTGNIDFYNLGVFVRSYPASQFGTGGTVVSRAQFDVNMARNDVTSSCKIYKRVCATIRKNSLQDSAKKKRLTNNEWEALATDVRVGGTAMSQVFSTPLVKLASGGMVSFSELRTRLGKYHDRIAVAPAKDLMADRLAQRGVALVVDEETISRFGYASLKEFCSGVAKLARKAARDFSVAREWNPHYRAEELAKAFEKVKIIDKKEFGKYVRSEYEDVPVAKLNAAEKFALQVIQRGAASIGYDIENMVQVVRGSKNYWHEKFLKEFPIGICQQMEAMCSKDSIPRPRDVRCGESDLADAWTDGEASIWINRENLKLLAKGMPGAVRLAQLVLHEMLHQSPSTGDLNVHDDTFYGCFHNLSIDSPIIGRAVNNMMDRAIRMLRQEKRKPTGALLKFEDQIAELTGEVVAPTQPDPRDESVTLAPDAEPEAEALVTDGLSMR